MRIARKIKCREKNRFYSNIFTMKSRELGPEHLTQSVARYASACWPTNPGHRDISIQYRVMAQNRFQPYMVVSQPSWIRRPWQINSAAHFEVPMHKIWGQYLNPVQSYGPKYVSTIYGNQSAILNWTTLTKSQLSCSFWGTNALILKPISQSSTELWSKIGFDHIWRSVGHLEFDDLDKK